MHEKRKTRGKKKPGSEEGDMIAEQDKAARSADGGPSKASSDSPGKTGRSIASRIARASVKAVFIWAPLSLAVVIALVFACLKIFLTPERVQRLAVENFNAMSYGTLELKVQSFSPYGGFDIRNIVIRNGKEYNNTKFVEIERLVLKYGFFSIFAGNIHFDEIGIYRPRVWLVEKKGVWNAARLMKPGEPGPEKEKKEKEAEEEKKEGPPSKEISLPIPVNFLFRFILDDLRVYARGSSFRSSMEGLTFTMDVLVPPFKKVPKSLAAVSILKKMNIVLNPQEEMDVSFTSDVAEVNPPLVLTWKLLFENNGGKDRRFNSLFKFGTYRTPVRFKQTHLAPLNFMLSYDLYYNPYADYLQINHLGMQFLKRKWFLLDGSVKNVTTRQEIDIRMAESAIVLDDLYPYFVSLTRDRKTRFSGTVSLLPLTVKGTPSVMDVNGELNLKTVHFKNPSAEADIPRLTLAYNVLMRGDNMKIISKLSLPHLWYALNRNKSGDNGFELGLDVAGMNGFQRVAINSVTLRYYNPETRKNALDVLMDGNVNLAGGTSGSLSIKKFTFTRDPLLPMLPAVYRKSLASLPLQKPLDMTMDVRFSLGEVMKAGVDALFRAPDFDVNDLRFALDATMNDRKKRATLGRLHLGSAEKGLSVDGRGWVDLKTPPMSDSDLRFTVKLESPKMKPVYGPWQVSGRLALNTFVRGDLKTGKAYGNVDIEKFFIRNDELKMAVDDVNMDFPFEYYFTPRYSGESRLTVDKRSVFDITSFREKENFTIKSIRSKHPARDTQFEYLRDFSATMFFRENAFEIATLKAYVIDGAMYGRSILFNLADMKKENMEFRLILDMTNVDIGKLDEFDPKKKSREAELSLNANFSGRGLDIQKELNMSGYVNIYKIGDAFANRLLKALNTEKGESKLGPAQIVVDNFNKPKGFAFNLDKGMVYTTVTFSRGIIGYIASVKEEKIEFDRMPIQEYARKVREVQ